VGLLLRAAFAMRYPGVLFGANFPEHRHGQKKFVSESTG
jgi:hypothetical protein